MKRFTKLFRILSVPLWYIKRQFQSKDSPPKVGEGLWSKKGFK